MIEGGNEVYFPSFAILTTHEEIAYREPEELLDRFHKAVYTVETF